jgi:cytochrome c biogenesis protein CcmG, thiol:disulfide interchange protein DsbE
VRVAPALLLAVACAHAPLTAMPALSVRTMDGAQVRLDTLRGPALVDLWATWCVPCAHALPFYARLAKETGIRVVAVSIDHDDGPVREWMARNALPFEVLRDPNGEVAEELGMRLMPTSFLVDAQGRVVKRHDGFTEADEPAIEREVRALMK